MDLDERSENGTTERQAMTSKGIEAKIDGTDAARVINILLSQKGQTLGCGVDLFEVGGDFSLLLARVRIRVRRHSR